MKFKFAYLEVFRATQMNPVEKYFTAERWYCAGGMGIAVLAASLTLYFLLKLRLPFYTGMAWAFLVLGTFFLVICAGVFIRSPKDITRVNAIIETNPVQLQDEELPRMAKVMRNFKVIMVVEISLIIISVVLLLALKLGPSWRGAFSGILIMALLLLAFDYLADKRGGVYHEFLKQQVKHVQ